MAYIQKNNPRHTARRSPISKRVGSSPLRVVTPDPAGQNYPYWDVSDEAVKIRRTSKKQLDLKQSQALDKLHENLLKMDEERKIERNKPLTDWMIEDLLKQGMKVKDMPANQGELFDYYQKLHSTNPGKYTKTLPKTPPVGEYIPQFFSDTKIKREEGHGRWVDQY